MAASCTPTRRFHRYPSMIRSLSTDESMLKEQRLYERHCKHLVGRLGRIRESSDHTDIILAVGDTEIKAHKVILAAFSPYFEAMLRPNTWDPPKQQFELHDLNGQTVEKLVDFAYTGKISYTDSTVQDVLETANFLDIEVVRHDCAKYIAKQLDALNFSDIYSLGRQIGEEIMYMSAIDYVASNICMLSKTAEFFLMPLDLLQDVLRSEDVQYFESGLFPTPANQENGILKAVLSYIDHDPNNRKHCMPDLLKLVRLPVLLPNVIASLQEHPLLATSAESIALINLVANGEYSTNDRFALPRDNKLLSCVWSRSLAAGNQVRAPKTPYDDTKTTPLGVHVTGMKIYERRWDGRPVWGGYEVTYSNGASFQHGGKDFGYSVYEFKLNEGEVIIRMDVNSGWLIDQVTFHTSLGRTFGPYGGPGGGRAEISHTGHNAMSSLAYLGGTKGCSVITQDNLAITCLQFLWVYCNPKEEENDRIYASDIDSGEEMYETLDLEDSMSDN